MVSVLWLSTSGSASSTVSSASRSPLKSGIKTSTRQPGFMARTCRTVSAQCAAPPSARSSRLTEVMTVCARFRVLTASATCRGSSGSSAPASPFETAQNPQWRVQMSPPIMKVAVRSAQHSKMFGQRASWQTVCRFRPSISFSTAFWFVGSPILTRSQSGFGPRGGLADGGLLMTLSSRLKVFCSVLVRGHFSTRTFKKRRAACGAARRTITVPRA